MKKSLSITPELYQRMEQTARRRGLSTVEQLLEVWQAVEEELERRISPQRPLESGREELFAYYGERSELGMRSVSK